MWGRGLQRRQGHGTSQAPGGDTIACHISEDSRGRRVPPASCGMALPHGVLCSSDLWQMTDKVQAHRWVLRSWARRRNEHLPAVPCGPVGCPSKCPREPVGRHAAGPAGPREQGFHNTPRQVTQHVTHSWEPLRCSMPSSKTPASSGLPTHPRRQAEGHLGTVLWVPASSREAAHWEGTSALEFLKDWTVFQRQTRLWLETWAWWNVPSTDGGGGKVEATRVSRSHEELPPRHHTSVRTGCWGRLRHAL